MGMHNPRTGLYEPIRRTITADGKPATRAENVIGWELLSGDLVYVQQMAEYAKARADIEREVSTAKLKIDADRRNKLGALHANFFSKAEGGQ